MPRSHFSRLPPLPPCDGSLVSPPHCTTPPWQPPQLTPKVGQTIQGRVRNRATPFKNTVRAYNPTKKATPLTWFEGGFFKVVGILLVVALVVPHWIAPPGRRHWVAGAAAATSGGRAMAISACLCECGCVCVADGPGQLMMPITNPARIYFSALGRLGGFPCRIFSSKDLSLYAEFFYRYVSKISFKKKHPVWGEKGIKRKIKGKRGKNKQKRKKKREIKEKKRGLGYWGKVKMWRWKGF